LEVLERFHQSSLNVAGFGRLARGIDQSLTTAHSVEVEFLRSQAEEVAGADESFAVKAEVVFGEVRERPPVEAEPDPLTFDVLLADTSHDLRDVLLTALRARGDHVVEPVMARHRFVSDTTRTVDSVLQGLVNLLLETFHHALTGEEFGLATLELLSDALDFPFELLQLALDRFDRLLLTDDVLDAYTEAVIHQPVVDKILSVREKDLRLFRAEVPHADVDDTARLRSDLILLQVAAEQITMLDIDILVLGARPSLIVVHSAVVDSRQNKRQDLLASPHGSRLDDGRWRQAA
jgi:hypothetical protein